MDVRKRCKTSTISRFFQIHSIKAQVTIFIIVGIVILFVFAGVLYFMKNTVTDKTTAEGVPIIQSVPTEFQPLQTYTENCIRDVSKQGLRLLGQQGGYIYPELTGKYLPTNPTEGNGISLGGVNIPYWYYRTNPNPEEENIYSSLQPKVRLSDDASLSIEAQLNRFVRERIGACLNEYQPFAEQGFTISVDNDKEKVSTTIGDASVNILLDLPVTVKKGNSEKELTKFYVQIPLQLKHYLAVADQIIKAEQDARFLEKQGLELLSIYSRTDSDYFAPISFDGYDLASSLIWSEANLEQKYVQLLTSHVPMLQFLGSANFYYSPVASILTQKATDNSVLTLSGAEDLDVTFNFVPSDIYFKTNSKNGVISPNNMVVHSSVLTFGFQQYSTHYDISYPVLITLRDPLALDGEDYVFNFALESNIRNNDPAPAGKPAVARDPIPISPIVCNPEQRDTGMIKTIVLDSYTKQPLDSVRIGFSIPEQAECEMGLTDKQGELEEKYPAVYGGVVSYLKQDYLTNFYPIDTYKLKGKSALIGYAAVDVAAPKVVELDKIKPITINVVKKNLEKCLTPILCEYTAGAHAALLLPYKDISCSRGTPQCFFPAGSSIFGAGKPLVEVEAMGSISRYNSYYLTSNTVPLADDEEALLTLDRIKGLHHEVVSDPFSAVASVKNGQPVTAQLVPGVYRVSIQVVKKSKLTIPADDRCFAYDIVTVTKEDCSTLSPTTMDSSIVGTLSWDSPQSYLTITPDQLYSSNSITFTVPVQDLATVPDTIKTPSKECGGFLCAGGDCLFESCVDKTISTSAKVVEDLQVTGMVERITNTTEYVQLLKPTFK